MTATTTSKFNLLRAATSNSDDLMNVWGDVQEAYGKNEITKKEFDYIVKILSKAKLWTIAG